jgi:hypothetical protein
MGTSRAAVARLEAGGVGATVTTLLRLAAVLDLELSLLSYDRAVARSNSNMFSRAPSLRARSEPAITDNAETVARASTALRRRA